jgi:hypothetical protein
MHATNGNDETEWMCLLRTAGMDFLALTCQHTCPFGGMSTTVDIEHL